MAFNIAELMATFEVKGATSAVRSIEQVQAGFTGAGEAATKASAGVDKATAAIGASGKAASAASASSSRYRAAVLSLVAAQERYNTVLTDENATMARVASAEASLIRARERVAAATNTAASSTRDYAAAQDTASASAATLGTRTKSMIATVGKLGVVVGAFEAIKAAIDIGKQASDYQRQMTQIGSLTATSDKDVAALSARLLGMAGEVAAAPEDLATSAYHAESALKKLGATAPQIYKTVQTAAEGARIGNADLEDTTNALTATMASGIASYNQAGSAMGKLLAIVGAGDMKVTDLNDALGTGLLVTMNTFGVSLTDTGAALAVYGDNNIRGADAATKLRMSVQDLLKPAAGADEVLGKIGVTADDLRKSMEQNGLSGTLDLLSKKMTAAGVTGSKVGGFLEDAFTKKAGAGLAILLTRLDQFKSAQTQIEGAGNRFGADWKAATQTASYALGKLGAEAEADGIKLATKLLPVGTELVHLLATGLPQALSIGKDAFAPFVAGWEALGHILDPVAHDVGEVAGDLDPVAPVLKDVAAAALAAWIAFKGYTIATSAVAGIRSAIGSMALTARADLGSMGASWRSMQLALSGGATESAIATKMMQAEFAQVAAAAQASAADQAEAQAMVARAYQTTSEEAISAMEAEAVAARETATATAAAADTAAAEVTAAGDAAAIGWSAMLGPIAIAATALAAVGLGFLHSGHSAQDAAGQINTYTDAIKADSGALADNTRQAAVHALQTAGALATARQFGISLELVTNAVLGNTSAQKELNKEIDNANAGLGKLYDAGKITGKQEDDRYTSLMKLKDAVSDQTGDVLKGVQAYKDEKSAMADDTKTTIANGDAHKSAATSLGWLVTAHGNLQQAEVKSGQTLSDGTAAMQAQTQASTLLKNALDLLNGVNENVEQSTDAFNLSLLQLKNGSALAKKANGDLSTSFSRSTVTGNQNRQTLVSLIDAAKTQAQAVADSTAKKKDETAGLLAGNKALKANEDRIRAAAQAAGLDKDKVDALIKSIGKISHVTADPTIKLEDEATAKLKAIQRIIDGLHGKSLAVNVAVATQGGIGGHHAAGGSVGDGLSTVGEQGYELLDKRGSNVQVIPHPQAVAMTGMSKIPGYANGTPGHISLGHAMNGTKVSALLGGGDLGIEWITKLSMAGKQLVATVLGVAASLQHVRGSSSSAVAHALAGAVAPDPTTAQGWQARLAVSQKLATADRERYEIAKQNVQALNQRAAAADRAAKKAQADAEATKSSTKAQKSAKDAAEAQAKALQTQADAVDKLASRAKSDFDKIKSASSAATQKMQSDAQSLVAALQADEQAIEQNFTSLSSTIAQGLTAGGDLSTMFGGLTSNVDSAQQALDAANSALQQATVDTSGLVAAQQQVTLSTAAQAAAHAQLTQALAGGDAAAILAAQQAQTTAASNLAAAQAAVTAATPTPDQLTAQAQAQQQVVAAQQALTAAQKAATASGAASAAAQFAASESQFSGDLTTLANKLGKSPAAQQLVTQLAGMGAAGGDALAQGLINDPKSRASLLASMSAISAIANTEGDALAQGFYGAGIKSVEKLIEGMEKKTPSLKKALDPILSMLNGLGAGTSYTVKKGDTLGDVAAALGLKGEAAYQALRAANPELAGIRGNSTSLNKFAGTSLVVPSFATGVTDFAGGVAMVHRDELLVNLPKGTDVIPANRTKSSAFAGADLTPLITEVRALRAEVRALPQATGQEVGAAQLEVIDRYGQAQADRDRRAVRKGAY